MKRVRQLAISVEVRMRRYPIVIFQLCAFLMLFDFSGAAWAALFGAVTNGYNLFNGLLLAFDVKARRRVLVFLRQFQGCRFVPVDITQTIGADFKALVAERSVSMALTRVEDRRGRERLSERARGDEASRATQVFVVTPPPGAAFPASPTAFPLRLGGYVFLLDNPGALRGAGRFIFLHELGHLAMAGNYYAIRAHTGYLPFVLVAAYALAQTAPTFLPLLAWVVYCRLGQVFLKTAWEVYAEMADANHEAHADFFAFANLDEDNRKRAASFLREYPITDTTLTPGFEAGRRQYLQQNIELIEAGEDRLAYPRVTGETPFWVWLAIIATALLGVTARRQDLMSVAAELLITVGTVTFLLLNMWRTRKFRLEIDAHLKHWLGQTSTGTGEGH